MSFPNRNIDVPQPSVRPAVKLSAVENRRIDATAAADAIVGPSTSTASRPITAIDAMALCMSGGCVGG